MIKTHTREQHADVAHKLCLIRNGLEVTLPVEVFKKKPKAPINGYWRRATRCVNDLRARMEVVFLQQFPEERTSPYYGRDDSLPMGDSAAAYVTALHEISNALSGAFDGSAPLADLRIKLDHKLWALKTALEDAEAQRRGTL
jgi:hypothetical protein